MWGGESYKAARVTGGESADKKEAFILDVKVEKKISYVGRECGILPNENLTEKQTARLLPCFKFI